VIDHTFSFILVRFDIRYIGFCSIYQSINEDSKDKYAHIRKKKVEEMVRAYTIVSMFLLTLLVTRVTSSQVNAPCTWTEISEEYDYCGDSLTRGVPWVSPLKVCCDTIKLNKMKCICQVVTKTFSQNFDFYKLSKLSHACGDLLVPGSYCGGNYH